MIRRYNLEKLLESISGSPSQNLDSLTNMAKLIYGDTARVCASNHILFNTNSSWNIVSLDGKEEVGDILKIYILYSKNYTFKGMVLLDSEAVELEHRVYKSMAYIRDSLGVERAAMLARQLEAKLMLLKTSGVYKKGKLKLVLTGEIGNKDFGMSYHFISEKVRYGVFLAKVHELNLIREV